MTRSPVRRLIFSALRRLLYLWVRSETINQSAFTLKLDRSKPVFYVLQQASLSDLAVLDVECAKAGLPRPVADVAVGEHVEPAAFFFLNPAASWFGRRSRLVAPPTLVRLVGALEHNAVENAQIVPVSVFWGQSPNRETSAWKLLFADSWAVTGRLRKLLSILVLGRKTRVQFSAPIQLNELVAPNKGHERTLRMVHRMLRVHFRNQKTAVIGPDLSHRRNLVKGLVHGPQVREAIREEAARENIALDKAEARALRYANEIASDYAYTAVRFLEVVLSWFWNKIYDGIRVSHIEPLQDAVRGYEVIYVPCHRSHIDYLLLSYLLFRNGLTPPHIAAGINLNMPVIGGLLRRGGAFFMRRTFKGNPLYTAVFNEYLHTLFSKGFPVEYFVEGGRSRTGRMLRPKTGMLAITLRSFLRSNRLPIVFVPVYIGYERVLEGRTYLGELRGASKKKESIFDLFKVLGALKQRFGQVSVNFGEPIKLAEFLDQQQPGWREQELGPQYRPAWLNDTTNRLGERVARRRSEREQHRGFAERGIDRGDARRRHHEPRCRAAEETAHFTEAACTRHEHGLTDASRVSLRADLADAADGFIARDERISHARERRHLAGPEKPLGAGADAAPVDVDDDLFGRRVAQGQAPQRELPRPLHHHGERVQSVTHAGLPT